MNINITGELPDCVTLHALNGESRTYFERFDRARHMVLVEPELWFRIEQEMTSLRSENAKLRELVAEMLDNLMPEICAKAFWCRDKDWRKCKDDACGNYTFVILARELGVTT